MHRASRRTALAGLLCVAGLGVAACGPVHAGAAATVGDTRITTAQVQDAAAVMTSDPGIAPSATADSAALRRTVLSRLIHDDLVARAAALRGISVSEADVQHERAAVKQQLGSEQGLESAAAQGGIAAADLHDYLYYRLLEQRLGAKLTAGQTLATAHVKVIVLTQKPLADEALARAQQDPSSFASLAKQYSQDATSAANGGDLGDLPTDSLPDTLRADINTKPLNVPFEETDGSNYYVILVTARGKTPLSQLGGSTAAQQIEQQAVATYLVSLNKQYPVSVNPRYGSWDPQTQSVVASDVKSPLSSPGPSSGSSQASLPSATPSSAG